MGSERMAIQILLWCLFLLPWISLFFLGRSRVRTFMPVALFAATVNGIVNEVAWTYHWWTFKETLFPWDKVTPLATTYGIFLAGTIWIFAFTFGRFWIYLIVNFIVDCIYNFGLGWVFTKLGIRTGNIAALQDLLLMTAFGLALYVYQLWQSGVILGDKRGNTYTRTTDDKPARGFSIRAKSKAR